MYDSAFQEAAPLRAEKPRLVIVGSAGAQHLPSSPLLRLIRDFAATFSLYELHATEETAEAILGTGLYAQSVVVRHRRGDNGGITQLAAMIARREVVASILFLDPNDEWSDAVENRALSRVCIQRHVRLITTYAAALRWLTFEAADAAKNPARNHAAWKSKTWREGNRNVVNGEFQHLPVEQRSIALISHDGKKHEMVDFIMRNNHLELLAGHDRILATGTTGWLLKLLFCEDIELHRDELKGKEPRLSDVISDILDKKGLKTPKYPNLDGLLEALRKIVSARPHAEFSRKVMPLPSGPDGGDVIAADEILNNKLHEVIFFQDPMEAHPHAEDIRLFERTARLPGVFSECVSDEESADQWMEGLQKEMNAAQQRPTVSQRLRSKFGLREAILIDCGTNEDGPELGTSLARACAGYLNQWLHAADRNRTTRIGVAWGWGLRQVLSELHSMYEEKLLHKPHGFFELVWAPIIGIITAEMTDLEASMIADRFKEFYGGRLERLGCAGFAPRNPTIPSDVKEIVANLQNADLILTSGSRWDEDASLAKSTGLDTKKFPPFERVAGTVSGVFLDENGSEVHGQYEIVGLGFSGLQQVAKKGAVVLMCGGDKRNDVVLSALRANIISVLISTRQTAEWVLAQSEEVVPGPVPAVHHRIQLKRKKPASGPAPASGKRPEKKERRRPSSARRP